MSVSTSIQVEDVMGQYAITTTHFLDGQKTNRIINDKLFYTKAVDNTTLISAKTFDQAVASSKIVASRRICENEEFVKEQKIEECLSYYNATTEELKTFTLPDKFFTVINKAPPPPPPLPSALAVDQSAQQAASSLAAQETRKEALEKLPDIPDPEIILIQAETEILEKKAEIEEQLLYYQENGIEILKQKLIDLALANLPIPLPIKLPLIDPRILQAYAIAKQIKKTLKDRKTKSKNNQKKGKKLYTYPLKKPDLSFLNLPAPPPLPLKNLPSLPTVNLPTNLPNIRIP